VSGWGLMAAMTILRVLLGGLFLESGLAKVLDPTWSAMQFLNQVKGPFAWFFMPMAGVPAVDVVVMYGEILIGVALILGLTVRLACFSGLLMMLLYYTAQLPPQRGWISSNVIYMAAFTTLIFSGIGRIWGVDRFFRRIEQRWRFPRLILG